MHLGARRTGSTHRGQAVPARLGERPVTRAEDYLAEDRSGARVRPRGKMRQRFNRRHILVTGSHRSGTTWLATMLATAPGTVRLASEPFRAAPASYRLAGLVEHWFAYAPGMDEEAVRLTFERILRGRVKRLFSRRQLEHWSPFPRRRRLIIKDPIAALSSEWLAQQFGLEVVVLVRHPGAFAASLKRLDWRFDPANFLRQKRLMNDHLEVFRDQLEAWPADIVGQAGILWKCLYHVLLKYADRNPDWIVRTHEELSRSPLPQLQALYERLALVWTPNTEAKVRAHTAAHNPVEAARTVVHQLRRHSAAVVSAWKDQLSREETMCLYEATAGMAARFYSEEDWWR